MQRARRRIFLYFVGLIIALQGTSFVEWLVDSRLLLQIKIAMVAVAIPVAVTILGMRFFPPPPSRIPPLVWSLNAVGLFVFWAGGYLLSGLLAYHGTFMSMAIPLDRHIPFTPEWIFVYLTVYFVFLLPLFYLDDRCKLVTLDLAQMLALTFSYTMFLYCPVAIDRPQIPVTDFASWTVSAVQGNDPPWNCFPSTHCVACTVATLAMIEVNWKLGFWCVLSTVAICISTVMTKQHFVLDAAAGILLGAAFFLLAKVIVRMTAGRLESLLGREWNIQCEEE